MGHIPVAKRFLKVRSYSLEKLGETIVNFWPFGVSAWYPMKFHFGAGDILMWIFYLISLLSFFLGSPYLFFTSFIFSGFTLCKNLIVFHCTHARSRCCLQLKRREVSGQWVSKLYPKDINMSKGTNCIFPQFSKKWSKSYYIYNYIYNTGYPFPIKHCENPHRQFSKTSAFLLERSSRSILWSGRGACIPSVHTDCTSWFGHWGFYVPAARTTSGVVHGQTITRQCHYVAQQSPNRSWDSLSPWFDQHSSVPTPGAGLLETHVTFWHVFTLVKTPSLTSRLCWKHPICKHLWDIQSL